MTKKKQNSPLVTLAKNDKKKKQKLSPLVSLAKKTKKNQRLSSQNSQDYFFGNE